MSTHVAIAFTTNGSTPKAGHRFHELVAVKVGEEGAGTQRLRQVFALDNGTGSDQVDTTRDANSFKTQFPALVAFVGSAPIVVERLGQWRGFLRAELPGVDKKQAVALIKAATESAVWSSRRFPKQRKDTASVAKRLGIAQDLTGLGELEREAEQLFAVGSAMLSTMERAAEPNSAASAPDGVSTKGTENTGALENDAITASASTVKKNQGTGLLGLRNRLKSDIRKN